MARSTMTICSLVRYFFLIVTFFFFSNLVSFSEAKGEAKVFNVMSYGAVADGKTDNSKAFLEAWKEACEWVGNARVLIPKGNYKLHPVVFEGPCKGHMAFIIKHSTLIAPTDDELQFSDKWINFRYVDGLNVGGSGTLHGEGASSWLHNCNNNQNCRQLPISVTLEFIKNGKIHHLRSIDSKNTHMSIFGCENLNLTKLRISAPDDSPNTDGIKVGSSRNVNITDSHIGTGDDCVAVLSGTADLQVSGVTCGPGHGISVGSLGKYEDEEDVRGIFVRNCSLRGTTNGIRIKTWETDLASTAEGFVFEDIVMENVQNPIIIDQEYCPNAGSCSKEKSSHVQITNVKYKNIKGSSSSQVAVNLRCSSSRPCKDIVLGDINLVHKGTEGVTATSFCSHVNGLSFGTQNPPSCL